MTALTPFGYHGTEVRTPPLRAKRGPRGQHVILASELTRWMREMPDA